MTGNISLPLLGTAMELSPSIRERIFAAADNLFNASDKTAFPTVDAVRRLAKVNMSDACSGMREWRRVQTPQMQTVPIAVPVALQQAGEAALQSLWTEAISVANEALQTAQTAWQHERDEFAILAEQMGAAFEDQSRELEAARSELTAAQAQTAELRTQLTYAQQKVEQLDSNNIVLGAAAERTSAVLVEIEQRATQQQLELNRMYAALAAAQSHAHELMQAHAQAIDGHRAALAQAQTDAERTASALNAELALAREDAARLRGTLAALEQTPKAVRQRAARALGRLDNSGQNDDQANQPR